MRLNLKEPRFRRRDSVERCKMLYQLLILAMDLKNDYPFSQASRVEEEKKSRGCGLYDTIAPASEQEKRLPFVCS